VVLPDLKADALAARLAGRNGDTALPPRYTRDTVTARGIERSNGVTHVTAPLAAIRNGGDIIAMTYPPLAWHVPRVVPEGLTLLIGAPKCGKSWLALAVTLAAATGGVVFGERLTPRPTLTLALEDSERRLQSRMRQLGFGREHRDDLAERWSVVTRVPAGVSAFDVVRAWLDQLPTVDPAPLVIIDTIGRARGMRPPNVSPYADDYAVGAAIQSLASQVPGMGVLATHHDRKATSSDFVDDVSGTHGLAGSADTIAVLRRDRHTTEGILLVTGRDVEHESAYAIDLNEGRWELRGGSWDTATATAAQTSAVSGRGDISRAIVGWLAVHVTGSPSVIADAIGESRGAVRQALYRMFHAGELDRDRGKYFLPRREPLTGHPGAAIEDVTS